MVGAHGSIVKLLAAGGAEAEYRVHVLEEPDHIRASASLPCEIRPARYHQSDEFLDVALTWASEVHFDAVVPGKEYGVAAAVRIADELGLPSIGRRAAEACGDKLVLRERCRGEVAQPRFTEVRSAQELERFLDGAPVILKPSNRHASLGVVRVDAAAGVRDAWSLATGELGRSAPVERPVEWRYIAEGFATGDQLSVETLLVNGDPVFDNVTLAKLVPGTFLESQFIAPAPIDDAKRDCVIQAARRMERAIGAESGMLHSEWLVADGDAVLVECAARAPGGWLPELLSGVWGFNLAAAFADVVVATPCEPVPVRPPQVGAIPYVYPAPGEVVHVERPERLASAPGVIESGIRIKQGDVVGCRRDNWSFAAHYVVLAPSMTELAARIAVADRLSAVETQNHNRNGNGWV